jgi:hypothetical protein
MLGFPYVGVDIVCLDEAGLQHPRLIPASIFWSAGLGLPGRNIFQHMNDTPLN